MTREVRKTSARSGPARKALGRSLVAILSTCLACAAHAESAKAPKKGAEDKPPAFSWAGMYLGANFGGTIPLHVGERFQALDGFRLPPIDLFPNGRERAGLSFGAQAGYNWQIGRFVYGVETDFNFLDGRGGPNGFFPAPGYAPYKVDGFLLNYSTPATYFASLRGRVGVALDRALVYATAGVATGGGRGPATMTFVGDEWRKPFKANLSGARRMKYVLGLGVEHAIADDTSLRFEYFYLNQALNSQYFTDGGYASYVSKIRNENYVLRLGVNHLFGEENSLDSSPVARKSGDGDAGGDDKDKEAKEELYSVHGVTTTALQGYPAFYAPYSGVNSFAPKGQARSGTISDLFMGIRLWEGASAYLNPEIDQGYGPQNTRGAASYVNASTTRVGSGAPYMRVQRYFMRQVIGLGGGSAENTEVDAASELLESTANQVAGKVDRDRLTLTVGKYSVQDIFDDNMYAHDPTKDFLNFAFTTLGSFDYAANAWGYTYGASLEWKQNWWTARSGVFQLSQTPGSVTIEPVLLRQYMAVGELEARYDIAEQPGVLKFLFFSDNGNFSKFDDVVDLAYLTGSLPPSVSNLRKPRQKNGVGINIAQQLVPNIGLFMRGGFNNGRYETVDYTDINKTFTAGLVFGGDLWERPDDKIGLAAGVSGISGSFARYLQLGGLGSFIGDGPRTYLNLPLKETIYNGNRLAYGDEKVLETFYKWGVYDWLETTVDYQFLTNPGYNTVRGPVNLFSLRVRAEF